MPKFKKCPRCDINYITDDKEYCDICAAEMRGITFQEIIDDEDEGELCPKCRINYLNEGETVCESCAALSATEEKQKAGSRIEEEYEWDKQPEEEESIDEDDIIMPDVVSLESLAEEENWDEADELGDDVAKTDDEADFDELDDSDLEGLEEDDTDDEEDDTDDE